MRHRAGKLALPVFMIIAACGTCFGAYGDSFEEDYSYMARTEAMFEEQGMKRADSAAALPAPVRIENAGRAPEKDKREEDEENGWEDEAPGEEAREREENEDTASKIKRTKTSFASQEKAYGPALEAGETVQQEETGPAVQTERLKETYHEEFEVYEENLADTYFIYTNVSNGGITDQAVRLYLPRNVTCFLEKDGEPISYMSNQDLGETGTYVMKLIAPSEAGTGGREPVLYQTVFRFRIQPKPEKKEEPAENEAGNRERTYWGDSWTEGQTGSGFWDEQEKEGTDLQSGDPRRDEGETEFMDEKGNYNQEAIDALIGDAIGDEEEKVEISPATGLSETYVEELGLFRETLLTGSYFYANIPNGMITNDGVSLELGDEITCSVSKDGEPYEFDAGSRFLEPGSYTVYLSGDGMDYTVSYSDKNAPQFHFRIVDGPVRDLEIFNVPDALTLQTVSLDKKPIQTGGDFFRLQKDGAYTAVMKDARGTAWESTVVKDTTAPLFSVRAEKDKAFLTYASEDIEKVVVTKDKVPKEFPILYELSGKGDYVVDVYDFAGNVSSASFHLSYSMNSAAVLTIVILLAAALGAALFLVRTKRKISVK